MKLDRDQSRIVSAALKAGAITRAQRPELLRLASTFGELSPRTIGLAVAVLRSGGLAEASTRASDEDRERLREASTAFDAYCSPVSVQAVPQCKLNGRRTDSACAPKASRFELGGVAGWLGARTEIVVEDAGGLLRLPARWALLPLGSLLTSHDPLRDFAPRPGYPPALQERDYAGGETEQQKVRSAAGNLYPELLLSDNRDALTGAPIIDRGRRVLGGNGRTMALILHAAQSSENRYARALARELACNTCFGLFGAPLAPDSVLVRVLEEVQDTLAISRQLNAPLSAAQTREVEAFSLGQRLSDRTLGRIATELEQSESIGDAIDRLAGALVRDLADDGIITPSQRPAWLQTLGGEVTAKLNRAGRERIVDAVIALSVRNLGLMRDASPTVLQLCAQIAPFVIRFDRWDAANRSGYNWAPAFRRALPYLVGTQELLRDSAELRAYWGTKQLFDAPELGVSPDTLKADLEGLACYWWLVSLVGRPRVASDRARRTWSKVPPELRGERGLYGLRDRLELAEMQEDPWSIRVVAGWPDEAAFLDLGANGGIGELTELRAELRDWDRAIETFNKTTGERPGVRAQRARLIDSWTPQVVPARVFTARAEEDRERLAVELRVETPRDFALQPFELPPRRPTRPAREAKPWQELRDAGLTLALAKRLAELGYTSSAQLRAALDAGAVVPGFGRARLAKLRAALGMPEAAPTRRKRERLTGGRADDLPDSAFDPVSLAEGAAHELAEHTTDEQTAREIAKDHLVEDPNYYPKLAAMESQPVRLELAPSVGPLNPAFRLEAPGDAETERRRARIDAKLERRDRESAMGDGPLILDPLPVATLREWFELRGWNVEGYREGSSDNLYADNWSIEMRSPKGVQVTAKITGSFAYDPRSGMTWISVEPPRTLRDLRQLEKLGMEPDTAFQSVRALKQPRNAYDAGLQARSAALRDAFIAQADDLAKLTADGWTPSNDPRFAKLEKRANDTRELLTLAEKAEIDEATRHSFREADETRERIYALNASVRAAENRMRESAQRALERREEQRKSELEQRTARKQLSEMASKRAAKLDQLPDLRRAYEEAKAKSAELAETTFRLTKTGASAARLSTVDRKWKSWAQERDRLQAEIRRIEAETYHEIPAESPRRTEEDRRKDEIRRARAKWFAVAQELLGLLQTGSKTSATEREIEKLNKQFRFASDVLTNVENAELELVASQGGDRDAVWARLMNEPQGVSERQSLINSIELASTSRRLARGEKRRVDRTCPTCKTPFALTELEARKGYQCQACTSREERTA